LRKEYARRADVAGSDERYSASNPAYRWMLANRQTAVVEFLERFEVSDLSKLRILEIGCGSGGVLQEFISLGAEPLNIYGVDLLHDRLRVAKEGLPNSALATANGQHLPFPSNAFDLVVQFTAFSSILENSIKEAMSTEIMRVLKPGQGFLWYDFIWNPLNRQTRGISLSEVRKLFPTTDITSRRITLAPPLSRFLIPRFQHLADVLARFSFLKSHLIIWIQKPN